MAELATHFLKNNNNKHGACISFNANECAYAAVGKPCRKGVHVCADCGGHHRCVDDSGTRCKAKKG